MAPSALNGTATAEAMGVFLKEGRRALAPMRTDAFMDDLEATAHSEGRAGVLSRTLHSCFSTLA